MNHVIKSLIIALGMLSLAAPFTTAEAAGRNLTPDEQKQIRCLAKNIYHEARSEPIEGQIAVAEVTTNRVATKRWGLTICEVVYSKKQFSWTNTDQEPAISEPEAWEQAWEIALHHWHGLLTARYSHNTIYYLNPTKIKQLPEWAVGMYIVEIIGEHWFLSPNPRTDTERPLVLAQHGSIVPKS